MLNFTGIGSCIKIALICMIVFFSELQAQEIVHGVVRNADDKSAVSYASVKLLHHNNWTYSDEGGNFTITCTANDTVVISSVGFAPKRFPINGKLRDTFYLQQIIKPLGEVIVTDPKYDGSFIAGIPFRKPDMQIPLFLGPGEFTQLISWPSSGGRFFKLAKLHLPVQLERTSPALLIHIYARDPKTNLPGEELLLHQHIIQHKRKKDQTYILDISEEKIWLNDSAVYVGVQALPSRSDTSDPRNKYVMLPFTFSVDEQVTCVRSLSRNDSYWIPFLYSRKRDAEIITSNTMFTVEVERYK